MCARLGQHKILLVFKNIEELVKQTVCLVVRRLISIKPFQFKMALHYLDHILNPLQRVSSGERVSPHVAV